MVPEEKSGVEKLKRALYARQSDIKPPAEDRSSLSPSTADAPRAWEPAATPEGVTSGVPQPSQPLQTKSRMSMATKFLLGSAAFFFLSLAAAAYMILGGVNTISPQNIDIEIVAPSLIDGGKEATFQFIITNRNQTDLELADLILTYPDGTRSAANPAQELTYDRHTIGTIPAGEQIKQTASALVFGQEGETQTIRATLEYSVKNSNAVFQKQTETTYTIGSSPVSITVSAPTDTTTGGEISMDVTVRSNATTPVENLVLQGQYPFGFTVGTTQPQADAGGTFWRLGTLQPGASRTIKITGALEGQDGDERVFRFFAGSNSDQTDTKIKVPFLIMPQTVTVRQPFISATIAVEGQTGKTISVAAGEQLEGTVTWKNNLPDPVSNVELILSFAGPALNKNAISAGNGFYQSAQTAIIWSKDQNNSLATVQPGETGTFHFSFSTLKPGEAGVLITNPTIELNLQVRGVRQGGGGAPESVASAATARVQLASQATLDVKTLHYTGGFQNIGPMPPRAEQATSYTIVWGVKNSANTVANASVSATLPSYVQFMSSPSGSGITYDAASRTVRWNIGDIKAGVGYTQAALQAAFQVTIVPSTSQVGKSPDLTSEVVLTGQDRFVQVPVRATANPSTTRLVGDSGPGGVDIVAPK